MKLTEFVIKEAILPSLKSTRKEDVIREMVASMKGVGASTGHAYVPPESLLA